MCYPPPKIRERNSQLTDERVNAFITRIADRATIVEDIPPHFNYARDPKDEKYINLAIQVGADYIVSRDKDMLDLMTGHSDECKGFRQRFRLLKIIEPVELLKTVESSGEQAG